MAADRKSDLEAAAREELEKARSFKWAQLSGHTPWGDTFEGFTPGGRAVVFDRSYLWQDEPGGDILVEVAIYEPQAFEQGVRLTSSIRRREEDQV
jgi:hypothetical protein